MSALFDIEVALDVPLATLFTYRSAWPVLVGQRVVVPFGRRRLCGVVANCYHEIQHHSFGIKMVDQVLDDVEPLPACLLAMARFAADYYHYPFGQTLFTALPAGLRAPKPISLKETRFWQLTALGAAQKIPARHTAQLALLQALQHGEQSEAALRLISGTAVQTMNRWQDRGWVVPAEERAPTLVVADSVRLNPEQAAALASLTAVPAAQAPWVLHGVTGSGKTEVYLQLMAHHLAQGQQVLVLVPEINLTPQLVARFTNRFPQTRLSLLHSHLSDGERLQGWMAAWQGKSRIVIGTRLSVFTPMPSLGLIIVDEEHDGSFKQQDGLRYHARDLAVWRARQAAVPIVLGSATPCLETLANVESGRYRRLKLVQRARPDAQLPAVRLMDIRRQARTEGVTALAMTALRDRLAAGELSLVYINRRGFAPVLACTDCGWISGCPHCSARLVLHLAERQLRCHHCGWEVPVLHVCPSCGNPDIKPLGEGTQRLEAALIAALPEARILRIDRDTTRHKDAWNEIYQKVHAGEVDILVGTQMLAKGHDFGSLSLVVILNADAALYSADFRASERMFAQLMQVSGRAGRDQLAGQVLLQTQWPDHPLYQALVAQDYDAYANQLLLERQQAGFPPACFQALLRAEAPQLEEAMAWLRQIRQFLEQEAGQVSLCGPAPALMMRLARRERAQLILESPNRTALHRLLHRLTDHLAKHPAPRQGRWSLDIDPLET